jgi:hypothetical protein
VVQRRRGRVGDGVSRAPGQQERRHSHPTDKLMAKHVPATILRSHFSSTVNAVNQGKAPPGNMALRAAADAGTRG